MNLWYCQMQLLVSSMFTLFSCNCLTEQAKKHEVLVIMLKWSIWHMIFSSSLSLLIGNVTVSNINLVFIAHNVKAWALHLFNQTEKSKDSYVMIFNISLFFFQETVYVFVFYSFILNKILITSSSMALTLFRLAIVWKLLTNLVTYVPHKMHFMTLHV